MDKETRKQSISIKTNCSKNEHYFVSTFGFDKPTIYCQSCGKIVMDKGKQLK